MFKVRAFGTCSPDAPLQPLSFLRRTPGPQDVQIAIDFCGVCHSDLHMARGHWGGTVYPCVPGHEIVGHVASVGSAVTRIAQGDAVGIGCMVDSCRRWGACTSGLEQYCDAGFVSTYGSPTQDPPGHTLGGYAEQIVVDENFVLRISHPKAQLESVAPLLCAGITSYSALMRWRVGLGKTVGVIGIGGLGHVAVKMAHALGAHRVAFSTSQRKRADILGMGADEVVVGFTDNDANRFIPDAVVRRAGAVRSAPLDRRLQDRRDQ